MPSFTWFIARLRPELARGTYKRHQQLALLLTAVSGGRLCTLFVLAALLLTLGLLALVGGTSALSGLFFRGLGLGSFSMPRVWPLQAP